MARVWGAQPHGEPRLTGSSMPAAGKAPAAAAKGRGRQGVAVPCPAFPARTYARVSYLCPSDKYRPGFARPGEPRHSPGRGGVGPLLQVRDETQGNRAQERAPRTAPVRLPLRVSTFRMGVAPPTAKPARPVDSPPQERPRWPAPGRSGTGWSAEPGSLPTGSARAPFPIRFPEGWGATGRPRPGPAVRAPAAPGHAAKRPRGPANARGRCPPEPC